MTDITIPLDDYKRLLHAAESDDTIIRCQTCGAWLDRDDPAAFDHEDYTGCWKVAMRDDKHNHLCRSYRAIE